MVASLPAVLLCLLPPQAGDQLGEVQPPLPPDLVIPAAPPLGWEQELETFRVPEGYRVELVAAEPLVADPVVTAWDERGRLWVCEMRAYMRDVDGTNEQEPIGVIAVLEDTDGDGRMDTRQVFLDGLVLPRAIRPIRGGLLYIEPPRLIFCRDTDGDGRGDESQVLETGLGGIHSPEHSINGLIVGVDNWITCSNHGFRFRWDRDGQWERQAVAKGGQWGVTKDDLGRIFFNTNPDPLRGDLYSAHYAVRNANHGRARDVNVGFAPDKRVWPARITPGVNRGYRGGVLRDDFTLASFTGACSPLIHRGGGLGEDCVGDAFVCEPCGNLVKRFAVETRDDGGLLARNRVEGREFLTSTDERFRPVHLADGPDGALYVVDMYRGLIQHRLFVTSFLREQVLERDLEQPTAMGRIWRVVREDHQARPGPDFAEASWTEVVAALAHPNGWWRDRAQQVLVEEGADDSDAIELTREAAAGPDALGRMHALWALDGMGRMTPQVARSALADADPRVVHAAMRCAEPWLDGDHAELVDDLISAAAGADVTLARQAVLSLGEGGSAAGDLGLLRVLEGRMDDAGLRAAALSGLMGRELDLIARIAALTMYLEERPGRASFLTELARCVGREGRSDRIEHLLFLAVKRPPILHWQTAAIFEGLLKARPKGPDGKPSYLQLAREPISYAHLSGIEGERVGTLGSDLAAALAWPGKQGVTTIEVRPLSRAEERRFDRGRELYLATCTQCHQESGQGEAGKAPRLRHSEYVLGDADRLVRIVRWGLVGPMVIDGERWDSEMPAWSSSDEDLAALLTYLRREWGHGADPVTESKVRRVSTKVGERSAPFTLEELR